MEKHVGALFAKRLKQLMEVRPDLDTQVKLAAATQMSQTTIGRILNKKVSPTLEHVGSIADAFGLTIGQVIAQDTEPKAELNYDRKAFARLSPAQKKAIESLVHYQICNYAAMMEPPPGIPEKRRAERRSPDSPRPNPDAPEKRKAIRRKHDAWIARG